MLVGREGSVRGLYGRGLCVRIGGEEGSRVLLCYLAMAGQEQWLVLHGKME